MRVGQNDHWTGLEITERLLTEIQQTSSRISVGSVFDYIRDWFTGSDRVKVKQALYDMLHSPTNPTLAIDAFMWLKEHAGQGYQSYFDMSEVIENVEWPPNSNQFKPAARIELSIGEFKVKTGACSDFLGEKVGYLQYLKQGSAVAGKSAAECIEVLETDVDRMSFLVNIDNERYHYAPGESSPLFHLVEKTESMLDNEVTDLFQKARDKYKKQGKSDIEALSLATADGEKYRTDYEEKWKKELRTEKAKVVLKLTDESEEQIINMAATCSQGVSISMYNDKPEYHPVGDSKNSDTLYKLTKFRGEANIMTMSFTKQSLTPEERQQVKAMSDMLNCGETSPIERKCNFEMRATFLVTKAHTYCVKVSWIDNDEMTKTVTQTRPNIGATA